MRRSYAMVVVSLGDLALDVIVRLHQPLALGADASSEITLSTGGQGANVAAWLAALGARARWVGVRADDDAGRIAAGRLERLGVELVGPVVEGRTGVIVSLVDADGQRSMCPDRGSAGGLRADDVEAGWLACDHLHLSGYALFGQPSRSAALRAATLARAEGARVSVDLSSWSGIRDVGPDSFRALLHELAPDVVFANEDEDATIGGRWSEVVWIVKRGREGCSFDGDERPALPVEVVDTTGAGDALAAGWIVDGADLGLEAAARCVAHAGSMP